MIYLLGVLGVLFLVVGGYALIQGASTMALRIGMSSLLIGLTVVAFGTSAPEQAVTLMSAFQGEPQVALGNVVGSNVANILLIIGLCALAVTLAVEREVIFFHVPVMLGFSLALYLLSLDGFLGRADGILLFSALLLYVSFSVWRALRLNRSAEEQPTLPAAGKPKGSWVHDLVYIVVGLLLLAFGSHLIVQAASHIALTFGVSPRVVGITVVAFGTSLPELIVSFIGCMRGERNLVIGNIVGSNIFNIGSVLGLTLAISPDGFEVVGESLTRDMPIVMATALVLFLMMVTHRLIQRWEGAVLLGWYFALMALAVVQAKQAALADRFTTYLMVAAVPATLLLLVLSIFSHLRRPQHLNEA